MFEAVARICRAVSVPVTADAEAGYGDSAQEAERTTTRVVAAGAVGLNLEDGGSGAGRPLVDLALQLDKIRAVRRAAERTGVSLVLNARTDVYLDAVGPESGRFEEAARRGEAYRDAGAGCVFVPGVTDPWVIGELVRRLACPVNVLGVASGPSIRDLASLGVARVSLGSGPMRAAVTVFQQLVEEVAARGTFAALEGIIPYAEMNERMR